MSSTLGAVRQQLTAFLGGAPFMLFSQAVMDATDTIDDDSSISDDDREWFDELYDAVYMAAEDPVDVASAREGIIGARQLREQLREMHLDRFPSPPL